MTNYARVGGILSIVAGGFGIFWLLAGLLFLFVGAVAYTDMGYFNGPDGYYAGQFPLYLGFVIFWCLAFTLLGALAIVGGVFALRRKNWGLALAGAIAGALVFFPCGVVAIIFTALGKPEFDTSLKPAAPAVV